MSHNQVDDLVGSDSADPRGERCVNHLRSRMFASLQGELDAGINGGVRCFASKEHSLSNWTCQRFPIADLSACTYVDAPLDNTLGCAW